MSETLPALREVAHELLGERARVLAQVGVQRRGVEDGQLHPEGLAPAECVQHRGALLRRWEELSRRYFPRGVVR